MHGELTLIVHSDAIPGGQTCTKIVLHDAYDAWVEVLRTLAKRSSEVACIACLQLLHLRKPLESHEFAKIIGGKSVSILQHFSTCLEDFENLDWVDVLREIRESYKSYKSYKSYWALKSWMAALAQVYRHATHVYKFIHIVESFRQASAWAREMHKWVILQLQPMICKAPREGWRLLPLMQPAQLQATIKQQSSSQNSQNSNLSTSKLKQPANILAQIRSLMRL